MAEQGRRPWAEDVKRHPEYGRSLQSKPGATALYVRHLVAVVFGIVFLFVSAFLFAVSPVDAPAAFRTAWMGGAVLFVVLGLVLVVAAVWRLLKTTTSKTESVPGLVVGKRTEVRGTGSGSASTRYHVTLELEDGDRRELEAPGKLYGKVTESDAGVAYVRDRHLIGYRRLAAHSAG